MAESLPRNIEGSAPPAGEKKPTVERQLCAGCGGENVRAVTMTGRFVYIRCDGCGEVWSIPERRHYPRKKD